MSLFCAFRRAGAPVKMIVAYGDVHGRDCSYNPSAFPPSLEVRRTNAAGAGKRRSGRQSLCISSIAPGRAGAAKHTTPWLGLFLQSVCISTIPGGQMEDNCRDAGARATQATGRDAGSYDSREGEGRPRREQRSRATQEQLPERLPSRHPVSMLSA